MLRLASLFIGIVVGALFILVTPTLAQEGTSPALREGLCAGVNLEINSGCEALDKSGGLGSFNRLIKRIINLLSVVVGIVAVIMIIVGGLRYITSGGSDTSVTGAKNTILYAIIGLIIVALAQVLVRFVLRQVTQT